MGTNETVSKLAHYDVYPNSAGQSKSDIGIEGGFYSFSENCKDKRQKFWIWRRMRNWKEHRLPPPFIVIIFKKIPRNYSNKKYFHDLYREMYANLFKVF